MLEELGLKELKAALSEHRGRKPRIGSSERTDEELLKGGLRAPEHADFTRKLRAWAEREADLPPPPSLFSRFSLFGSTGDRSEYEADYFERRYRLFAFAAMYWLDDDPAWLKRLEDTIWTICDEYTWVLPAHVGLNRPAYPQGIWDREVPPAETVDLFAAETAFALAELLTLLEGKLHPWIEDRIRREIERRVFAVYFGDPSLQNWETKTNNWPAVCAAGAGAAALYLVNDVDRLAGMLWRAFQSLRAHLSGFDEQGATPEGITYWEYGFGFYTYFSELLRSKTAGRIDLLEGRKQELIAKFPAACLLSRGATVNFSDAPETVKLWPGLVALLESRFGFSMGVERRLPDFEGAARRVAPLLRGLIWTMEHQGGPVAAAQAPQREREREMQSDRERLYFPGHQWLISKVLRNGRLYAFAAKGGHNGEPHNHNDIGHFIVHADGVNVLCDLGAGLYTRQYFVPEQRYATWTAGSGGHSVPVVAGAGQRYGADARAKDVSCEEEAARVRLTMEMAEAYGCESLRSLTRTFDWDEGEPGQLTLTLTDRVRFDGPLGAVVEEALISAFEPRFLGPGALQLGEGVRVEFDADFWSYRAEALECDVHSGEIRPFWRIALRTAAPETVWEQSLRIVVRT